MLVILIDVFESAKIKSDYIINNYENVLSISFSKSFLDLLKKDDFSFFKKVNLRFKLRLLKAKIRSIIKKLKCDYNASYVFSKTICGYNEKYDDFVLESVLKNIFKNLYEIKTENLIFETINRHLNDYLLFKNVNVADVKILYVIENFDKKIYENIIFNINKFKCIDIAYLKSDKSLEYKSLKDKIDFVNNELGSSISFVKLNCNMDYNVYFNFTNNEIKNEYLIDNSSLFINCLNNEQDSYNKYNILYNKNIYEINRIFNKLEIRIEKFDKTKIGKLIFNKCLIFKEE